MKSDSNLFQMLENDDSGLYEHKNNRKSYLSKFRQYFSYSILLSLSLFSFVIGYIGHLQYSISNNEPISFYFLIYQSINLFFLDADVSPPIPFLLILAMFLSPLITIITSIKTLFLVLNNRISYFLVRFRKNHLIVFGVNTLSTNISNNLSDLGYKVVLVDTEWNLSTYASQFNRALTTLVVESLTVSIMKLLNVSRASKLISFNDMEFNSHLVAILDEFFHHYSNRNTDKIEVLIKDTQSVLVRYLELTDSANPNYYISSFDPFKNLARSLFMKYPLDSFITIEDINDDLVIHILGFEELAKAVILQLAKIAHYPENNNMCIIVSDEGKRNSFEEFCFNYPHIDKIFRLYYIDQMYHQLMKNDNSINHNETRYEIDLHIVTYIDQMRSTSISLSLLKMLPSDHYVLFYCHETAFTHHRLTNEIRIIPFGFYHSGIGHRIAIGFFLDKYAKRIHNNYTAQRKSDGTFDSDDISIKPWIYLKEEYKESNRQQADHMFVKLRILGYELSMTEFTSKIVITDEELEMLAKVEHKRWMANRYLAGWNYGEERDNKQKLNPYLVPYEDLTDQIKEYDRQTVRTLISILEEEEISLIKFS